MMTKVILSLAAAAFGFFAVALLIGQLNWFRFNALARRGVKAAGEVTKLDAQNHRSIHYSYRVGQQVYQGIGKAGYGNPEFESLKAGDQIMVYYDPTNPSISVLGLPQYRLKNETIAIVLAASTVSLIAFGFVYRSVSRPQRV